MKKRFLSLWLVICAAMLLFPAAFAANGSRETSPAANIELTNVDDQRSGENTYSFQFRLSGADTRGSIFTAVYAESGQMKSVEMHDAQMEERITLHNVLNTDKIKAMWVSERNMPLAQTEVSNTETPDSLDFTETVLGMIQSYGIPEAWAESDDPYLLARLVVRSDDPLPDLSAFHVVQRASDGEGHTVLQFGKPQDARACAEYLLEKDKNRISSNGYVAADTVENVSPQEENANEANDAASLSWGVPVIQARSYAESLLNRGINHAVTVAVVDTGVDRTHEFLKGRTVDGYDFVDNDDNPHDEHYHGTHVAGTIVDCTPGLTNLKIMPVRVLNASGSGTSLNVSLGIKYAADHGADVINMSLGGAHNNYKDEAVDYAISKNVIVVVAAGNSGADTAGYCPAHITQCITVAAVDQDLQPAGFSNYGDEVDVAAPGVQIKSCVPGGGYKELSGTSMASPHVAACAAMLRDELASLTPEQAEKKLKETVQTPSGWSQRYGKGVAKMEPSEPVGFYALLYRDGEMVFQRGTTPAQDRELLHDPYPVSTLPGASGEYTLWYDQRESIKTVTFAEEIRPISTALWFYGCKNLTAVRNLENLDTANVTDMSQMFSRCSSLTALDLTAFDTGNVVNMNQMFFQCGALKTVYASDMFRISKVTNGTDMFSGCTALTGGAGTKYDPSHTDHSYARIDGGASTPGYFTGQFAPIYALLYADGELAFQNSTTPAPGKTLLHAYLANSVAQYAGWYDERESIKTVTFAEEIHPLSTALWFYGCKNLTAVRNLENLDTARATNMSQMFARCTSLQTLDLTGLDTGNADNMGQMFFQCGALTTIHASDTFRVTNVTNGRDMFTGCTALTGGAGTKYDPSHTDHSYARIDGGASSPGYFSNHTVPTPTPTPSKTLYVVLYNDGELVFQNSLDAEPGKTVAKTYETDSQGYGKNGRRPDNYMEWYGERESIRSVRFAAAIYPTSTAQWFYDCENLSSVVNPGNLHTDLVTDMSQMFMYCENLISVDLSGFRTGQTSNTALMFYNCEKLSTIYASSSFTTDRIDDSFLMFNGCTSLRGGNGTTYSSDHTDHAYARIDAASTPGYFTQK